MTISVNILLGLGLILLALEHFGVAIPGWLTGIVLMIAGVLILIGGR